jgi:hypothetical protein
MNTHLLLLLLLMLLLSLPLLWLSQLLSGSISASNQKAIVIQVPTF